MISQLPFYRVALSEAEISLVNEVLRNGWLTSGEFVQRFEREFAKALGVRFACAVNSCTAALHLAVEALGIGPGAKVFVPTMTFTATAEILRYNNAHPVFLDVDVNTGCISPEILRRAIADHPDVKHLILVHFGGLAAEMSLASDDGIVGLCRKHGVTLIEDAAHAFPASNQGRAVGTFGRAAAFSFYANKTLTTGEGGMLVTDDPSVHERACLMRCHGINRSVWDRFRTVGTGWEYDVVAPGFKYNMTDIAAAIGLGQLSRKDTLHSERMRCARQYLAYFRNIPEIQPLGYPADLSTHAIHLMVIKVRDGAPVDRDGLIKFLNARGIGTSLHYKPLHRMSYYRTKYQLTPSSFPGAESLFRQAVSLPLYPTLSDADIRRVCHLIDEAMTSLRRYSRCA